MTLKPERISAQAAGELFKILERLESYGASSDLDSEGQVIIYTNVWRHSDGHYYNAEEGPLK